GTTTADENGDWTLTIDAADALEDGAHSVSVTATLDDVEVDAQTINFNVDAALNDDDVEFLIVGGCSSSGGAPVGGASWLLAALGLFFFRSRRRDLGGEKRGEKAA
ncbi:MAG: MYXO-CTERM sorting domain-containing protein, partial [Myxococcota bacterium]|nr:MYXO-CTERM sorting domain-containing protein [Myxococcota bacterium]